MKYGLSYLYQTITRALFGVVCIVMSTMASANGQPTLAQITLELSKNTSLPLADTISFELQSSDPTALAKTLAQFQGLSVNKVVGNTLIMSLSQRPQYTGEVKTSYTQASFVIDYDELSTAEFINLFASSLKAGWGPKDIQRFVNQYITEPSYVHGFNIASVVAKNRTGDCTEYAVLSASLARALDMPARVVFGSAIIEEEGGVSAFGHAWTEVWHKGEWKMVDAALHNAPFTKIFYLPTSTLSNEGPGFMFGLLAPMSMLPAQISQVRNTD